MKDEKITIRISSELKDKLTALAESNNQKLSQYIRTQLVQIADQSSINQMETRIEKLEEQILASDWGEREVRTLKAGAEIISIKSGAPMDQVLESVTEILTNAISRDVVNKISRAERELHDLDAIQTIKEKYNLSDHTELVMAVLILTTFGHIYSNDIFQPFPLSVRALKLLRELSD